MAQEELPGSQPFLQTPDPPAHVALRFGLDAPFTLGQYQVQSKIGQGGMGMVYRAVHGRLKKSVAIKVLPPDCMADDQAVKRFEREMEAIGRLDHHNIVRATDAGEAGGVHFLVMELVEGIDLGRLLREHGPLKLSDACELIRQAATGLQAAHEKGLVHRDIKPSNLLLSETGVVKVVDLGLALLSRNASSRVLTATHQAVGTADYMAPEQWEGSHGVDIRADIYSLGCTLYVLLVGRPPFGPPDYDSAMQKMAAHANAPVKPLSSHGKEAPREIEALIQRMTAKKPEKRPQTPAEVEKALEPFCQGADVAKLVRNAKGAVTREEEKTTDQKSQTGGHSLEPLFQLSQGKVPMLVRRWRMLAGVGGFAILITILVMFIQRSPGRITSTPIPLDDLPPGRKHSLLKFPPVPVNANVGDNARYGWDPDESIELKGDAPVLLLLGETNRPIFTLDLMIRQATWVGGVGVFWGYQEDLKARERKQAGVPFAYFQMLYFYTNPIDPVQPAQALNKLFITRTKGTLAFNNLGEIALTPIGLPLLLGKDMEPLVDWITLPVGERHLLLGFSGHVLKSAKFNGVDLKYAATPERNKNFESRDYKGGLGVYALKHKAAFFRHIYFTRQ